MTPASLRGACGLLVVLVITGAAAPSARAQGFYFREIHRDGRIYVFNDAAAADRFEKTGESKAALTRPGAGPNGETVVADSARALQLYFFKHGIAEAVPEPPAPRVEWRDGKTRITAGSAYLEISNRVQVRYTHEFPDEMVSLAGLDPGESRGSFRVRRAKLKLEGWFWKEDNLSFEVQMNWPAASASNPGAFLEDANLAWDPAGTGAFRVVFGQFKPPFGLQELTSSGNLSFVDRSLVSNEYARGRDAGVAVQGVLFENRIEYRAGVFNGNGVARSTNDNAAFQVNGRLMWQPNGREDLVHRAWVSGALYSEPDFESTTTPIYAIGVNYEHNDFHGTTAGNDLASNIVGIDGIFKFKGVSATGAYFWRRRSPEVGDDFRADGYYLQSGVMLNPQRTIEGVIRYGSRDVNDTIDDDGATELRGGVSYYYRRHLLKLQLDAGRIESRASEGRTADSELRVQAQFVF
jgi:phosphate-selective porin OprO/OprP